jgi:DNA polymerase V
VIDRSRTAADGSIIIALLDGEFTIKRYRKRGNRRWLEAENPNYKAIELTEEPRSWASGPGPAPRSISSRS